MLIFDQLKKDDPQLRFLALMVLGGMLVLFSGLWWIQVVSVKYYQEKLETQSIRTVRIPAVRGKILDREGRPLAENRPSYNVDLYLGDLSAKFQTAYTTNLSRIKKGLNLQIAEEEKRLRRKLTPQEKKQFALPEQAINDLKQRTRYQVSSNIVAELGSRLQHAVFLQPKDFQHQYDKARALPLLILPNMDATNVARFEEQSMYTPGLDLDIQSIRYYPNNSVAAHLLGYLQHNNDSIEGETADYNYRLSDYKGVAGIEGIFNEELHGTAGSKSVLVNNLGYRQNETIWGQAEPGQNLVLTIDLDIQKAAEAALEAAKTDVHGAVVVMDARSGDILAMTSAPSYNPNHWVQHPDPDRWKAELERWQDPDIKVQMNRAMQENYPPGSIFKIVVGLAALEQGVLDPNQIFHSLGYYLMPGRRIKDTAGEGDFDFSRALAKSSNPYFITQGLKPGVLPKMVALGHRLHFGERTELLPRQETKGLFPSQKDVASTSWRDGITANLSIGQGPIDVTPLQIAVMISAMANGGNVLWPRIVARIESPDGSGQPQVFPEGRVRDTLGVGQGSLRIVHEAMLADVESAEGTGHAAAVPGLRIAGKTGTAEVERGGHIEKGAKITWFASFAPVGNQTYAVIAMVESGESGGKTCAPIAHKVYLALQQREQLKKGVPKPEILARTP